MLDHLYIIDVNWEFKVIGQSSRSQEENKNSAAAGMAEGA